MGMIVEWEIAALAVLLMMAAVLYTSVGHAGASAYLAIMALFGLAPEVMRPTALVLNILVAGFSFFRFYRANLVRWRSLWRSASREVRKRRALAPCSGATWAKR